MATRAKERSTHGRAKDETRPAAGDRRRSGSRARTARSGTKTQGDDGRRRWSAAVTRRSDALDLEPGVFKRDDPKAVARSLKRSADRSTRRKSDPYRSAMSMLTFYLNRAGKNVDARQRRVLERAKDELRRLFGRERKAS